MHLTPHTFPPSAPVPQAVLWLARLFLHRAGDALRDSPCNMPCSLHNCQNIQPQHKLKDPSSAGLFLCRAAVGLGEGVAPSASTDMLARLVDTSQRSRATSYMFGGLHVGSLLGLLVAPPLIETFGWQTVSSHLHPHHSGRSPRPNIMVTSGADCLPAE